MCCPSQSARGDFNFTAPIMNCFNSSVVLVVGGVSLAVITFLAFKALGIGNAATTVAMAAPVTLAAMGIVGVVVGAVFVISIAQGLFRR
jgi:hypothetical protein